MSTISIQKPSHYKDIPFVDLYDLILENIEDYYHEESDLLNKSISDTIEEATLSLFLLLQPDEKDIQEYIKDLGIRKNTQKSNIKNKKGTPVRIFTFDRRSITH